MKLAFIKSPSDFIFNPDITHYEGGGNFGIDLDKEWIQVNVKRIIFDTRAKKNIFLQKLKDWKNTLQLSIQIDTAGTLDELDGTNTVFPVKSYGANKIDKIAGKNGTYWEVGSCRFEQSGTAS